MEIKEIYNDIMLKTDTIALATSVNDQPNVRIISYIYDDNKIYFTSFKGRPKSK